MRNHLIRFTFVVLTLAVVRCQINPHPLSKEPLTIWLVGQDEKMLLLDAKAEETVPPTPVRKDEKGIYYGSRLVLTEKQVGFLQQAKNPAIVRLVYDEKKQFLGGEAYPIPLKQQRSRIDLPGEQLIPVGTFQITYQVLDYPISLPSAIPLRARDPQQYPWSPYASQIARVSKFMHCYLTFDIPCSLERCLRYPPEFNFESLEILANAGTTVIKTLTSADCAINLAASQALLTTGPTATFRVRANIKRLHAAPAGSAPIYSLRYSNSSLPSRLEASHWVTGDFSSLASLAVGSVQPIEFQLSWVLPAGIGPKDFFIVNNATFDAILAKGGCTTPSTMQYYAEDQFRFNLNGAGGGCL
ncbi:hypothetical protein [Larkinella harenae]